MFGRTGEINASFLFHKISAMMQHSLKKLRPACDLYSLRNQKWRAESESNEIFTRIRSSSFSVMHLLLIIYCLVFCPGISTSSTFLLNCYSTLTGFWKLADEMQPEDTESFGSAVWRKHQLSLVPKEFQKSYLMH